MLARHLRTQSSRGGWAGPGSDRVARGMAQRTASVVSHQTFSEVMWFRFQLWRKHFSARSRCC